MMNLTRLSMENFLSHKRSVLKISDKRGLVLIEGINEDGRFDSNGSGKSAILEGILYGLTGSTLRNLGVNEVVNRNVGKDTEVTIDFSTDKGGYQVNRYRKHSVEGNKIKLWDIGEDLMGEISKRLDKETQKLIDDIIDIPYQVLVNTILLGEGLSSRFTQLSDPDKKSLIESTLNLNYDLSACRASAKKKMQESKARESYLVGRISTLDDILSHDLESVMKQRNEAFNELSCIDTTSIETQISDNNNNIGILRGKVMVLQDAINRYYTLDNSLAALDAESVQYINEITRITSEPDPCCSLCHQVIRDDTLKQSYISGFQDRLSVCTNKMKEVQSQFLALPDPKVMQNSLAELQKNIAELENTNVTLSVSLRSMQDKRSSLQGIIESSDRTIASRQEHISQRDESIKELEVVKKDAEDYDYLQNMFSPTGIVTLVLEEAIQYINSRIKVYTEILMDKSYELTLSKGKIVLSDSTGASYQSLSNGEKRRLDIAIQFSLHDYTCMYCGVGVNILFIDEILDTLDATGVNNIIEVLNMKLEYCKLQCIFVITHNSSLKSYFDEVITVRKGKDGNSSIV